MKVLISERLSPHKYKTPEGYLICVDAVLARTGKQTYRRSEIFDTDDDSEIDVDRKPEEVFSQSTLASFENKPVTVEHPDEDVNSANFKDYAVGFVRDVKKGTVDGQDVILGTLVIQDAQTIEEIENGEHTDLSCGYDCDIDDSDSPEQKNIRGNHVALCQCGRAGNARIVDSKTKDAYYTIGGYAGKYDPVAMTDIKRAAKYGVNGSIERTSDGWQLVLRGTPANLRNVIENYFALDPSGIEDSVKDELCNGYRIDKELNEYVVYDKHYNKEYGRYKSLEEARNCCKYDVFDSTKDEKISGPRGTFTISEKSKKELEAKGYGYHHSFEKNGKTYYVMTKNNSAVACTDADDKKFIVVNKKGKEIYQFKTREEAEQMVSSLTKAGEYGYHIKDAKYGKHNLISEQKNGTIWQNEDNSYHVLRGDMKEADFKTLKEAIAFTENIKDSINDDLNIKPTSKAGTDKAIYVLQSDLDKNLFFYIGKTFAMKDGSYTYQKFEMNGVSPEALRADLLKHGWHDTNENHNMLIDEESTYEEVTKKLEEGADKLQKKMSDSYLSAPAIIRFIRNAESFKEMKTLHFGDENMGYYVQIQNPGKEEYTLYNGKFRSKGLESASWGRVWYDGRFLKAFEGPYNVVRQELIAFLSSQRIQDSMKLIKIAKIAKTIKK